MYQIVIVPSNSSANTALSYKTQANFDIARKNIHEKLRIGGNLIVQDDDAGQIVEINADSVSYCMYIDINKQQEFAMFAKAASRGVADFSKKILEDFVA